MTFVSERKVKAVRKPHQCNACLHRVEVGEPAINWAGLTDGDFSTAYYHVECREAEVAYNQNCLGWWHGDDWAPLHDADSEDRLWLNDNHPLALQRLQGARAGQ